MRKTFQAAAGAVLLALAGSGASAQGVAQPGYYHGDVAAFHGNADSLVNAIAKVEQTTGAKVVQIAFAPENGLSGYHLALLQGRRVTFMHLDEQAGQVVGLTATNLPDWMLNWRQRSDIRYDKLASVPLSDAIRTAEAANGGAPAIAAGLARSANNPQSDVHAYNVVLDVDGSTRRVSVDSSTGQIIADPGALSWP